MSGKKITAEIITIGDEILYGQTLDTNSHWISGQLDAIGIRIVRKSSIQDNKRSILEAFAGAEKAADIVLITGGLGPTPDDLTKPLLAEYFNVKMKYNQEWLELLRDYFESRGKELSELNKSQALLPENATMLKNARGTAPGMWFFENNTVFVSLPGVPHEMEYLMVKEILPRLKGHFDLPVIYHKRVKTIGVGESDLANKISSWEKALPENISLAYLPGLAEVQLRLTATGSHADSLEEQVYLQINLLKGIAGKYIYGYDDESIEMAVGKILKSQEKTVSTAESCSGGYVSHLFTSVPGSSQYFLGGVISYSNEVKKNQLHVSESALQESGAVSEEVVLQMAENVRKEMNSDIGLAISGIAGPDGGTEEKPVGTIWIAYADENGRRAKVLRYNRERLLNIKASSKALLNLLRIQLLGL